MLNQYVKNEAKLKFQSLLMEELKTAVADSVIKDSSLKALSSDNGIRLSNSQIQECIRKLETRIGKEYEIRLVRIRNEGYRVVAGDNQYYQADSEGKKKLRKVFKKQVKRLEAVDLKKVSQNLRATVTAKTLAYSALAQLAKAALENRQLTTRDVGLITNANLELKALEQLKKAGL